MDQRRKREVDAAGQKIRREQFFAKLVMLVAATALISFFFAALSAPPSLVEMLQGRVAGEFAVPSRNPQKWRVTVQLDVGGTVSMAMPRSETLRQDTPMKVAHMRKVIGPLTQDSYVFAGYAEAAR